MIMVRIRNLLFVVFLMFFTLDMVVAQRIRKDHKEMTPSERSAYVNALKAIQPGVATLVATHTGAINVAHGTQLFFPWHRMFILDFENRLRNSTGSNQANLLTVPYWDWRTDFNSNSIQWDDQSFLGQFNMPNFTWFGNLGRTMSGNLSVDANQSNADHLNDRLNVPGGTFGSFQTFVGDMEGHHNVTHGWVGGAMSFLTQSPRDPAFYLHHGFMDKLWQEWEDRGQSAQSVFTQSTMPDFPGTNPSNIIDARVQDTWYAFNQKLLLDGLRGDFNTNGSRTYCYVAWNGSSVEGTIYAGNVMRDANDNVVADNKGRFVVQSGTTDFSAGSAIELLPGFDVLYGANFSAQIVDRPCGYSSNFGVRSNDDGVDVESLKARNSAISSNEMGKVYPNPFGDELNVAYEVGEDTPLSIQLVNALGQTIWQQNFGTQPKGAFQTTIPTNDLVKGLYTVLIKTNAGQKVFKAVH
jgi:tyrosinase